MGRRPAKCYRWVAPREERGAPLSAQGAGAGA